MATDSTHLLPGDTSIETDTDMSAGSSDLSSVQLAAATADAPIPVNIPLGQQVVVIPVKPGQTIELPTDSVNGLLAKLGADGNLAIVVDGRTIILQGYAEANAESPIKIVTNDGDLVDVAEVIVATNPDIAIDIQTAAGPAAGAQGGTAGAPGSGIFVPFAAGPLLGGFDGEGVLKATQLAYKNIDDERELFPILEEGNDLPKTIIIIPDEGQPVAEDGAFLLDEDFLPPDGNQDLPSPSPADDDGSNLASGTVVVDFGLDGPRAFDPIVMSDIAPGTPSGLFALGGGADPTVPGPEIQLFLDAPAGGFQVLHGRIGGTEYFTITLDTTSGHFTVEQLLPLFHDEISFEDNAFLDIEFTAFDSNSDSISATLHLNFDDDMPEIVLLDAAISLAVDETVSFSKLDFDDKNFPNDGIQDGSRIEGDEILAPALPASLQAIGAIIGAAIHDASLLFGVSYGADGAAAADSKTFDLTILDANTGLTDTETGQPITLVDNAGVIEGRNTDGDVVFALTIDSGTGDIAMAQYRAIDHGDEEADPGAVDEVLFLGSGHLAVTLTATDGDGDETSAQVDIGNSISFEDDGPEFEFVDFGKDGDITVVDKTIVGAIDEDDLPSGIGDNALGDDLGGTLVDGVINFNFGSDQPGSLSVDSLTVTDQAGNVINLADLKTSDSRAIEINKSVDGATGIITWEAVVAAGETGAGDPVFTFTLDGSGAGIGAFTFELHQALQHPYTDPDLQNDGPETLYEDNLLFDFTVIGEDGDGDEATGHILINVDDDSPTIELTRETEFKLAVDESVGGSGDAAGGGTREENDEELETLPQSLKDIGTVIGAATADAEPLFSVDFGADGGAATGDQAYAFKILDKNSGLTDTETGLQIILVEDNGMILGVVDDGDDKTTDPVAFALTIDADGDIAMAQYRAVDHGDEEPFPGEHDEVISLGAQKLAVALTATDADGDTVTATRDIGGAVTFDDDGPTLVSVDFGDDNDGEEGGHGFIDEDELPTGNKDGAAGDGPGGTLVDGVINFDFGSDQPGALQLNFMDFTVTDSAGIPVPLFNLKTVDGQSLLFIQFPPDPDGVVVFEARVLGGPDDGASVFKFTIDTQGDDIGTFSFELFRALEHPYTDPDSLNNGPDTSYEDNLLFDFRVVATDGDGDEAEGHIKIDVDDDSPVVTAASGSFALVVDETVADKGTGDVDDPDYGGPIQDGTRVEDDEHLETLPPSLTGIGTVIGAATADASVLFSVNYGADGGAFVGSKTYTLTILDANTGLIDTQTQQAITLVDVGGGVIEGQIAGGIEVFALTVDPVTGAVSMAQYRAVDHGDEEGEGGAFDEVLSLGSGKLAVTLTAMDADGDKDSESVDIGSGIAFEDDGPTFDETDFTQEEDGDSSEGIGIIDEDALPGGIAGGPGDDAGGLQTDGTIKFDFGSDKAGSLSIDGLKITDSNGVEILLADLKTADGTAVQTKESLPDVNGVVTYEGYIDDGKGGTITVFTLTLDTEGANIGAFEFNLEQPLQHPYTDPDFKNDGPETEYEDNLRFDFTIVATDGDGDEATGHIQVSVDDDSPDVGRTTSGTINLTVDETVADKGTGDIDANGENGTSEDGSRVEDDEHQETLPAALTAIGQVIGAATADASVLFDVDFGADGGATSGDEAFSFTILNANTSLIDTETGDPITLFNNGGVIEGRNDDGAVVFALTIDGDGNIAMAQYRAVNHGDDDPNSFPDEVVSLGRQTLAVTLTVTDADGDQDSESADIGSSIRFEDDGPTTDLALKEGAKLVLDESVGTDALDPNADDEDDSLDPNDIGYAKILAGDLFSETTNFGSDKEGSPDKTFSLVVNGIAPVLTGLVDTQSGQNVVLVDLGGGVVEGRTQVGGLTVFKVTVNGDGDIEVFQYRAVEHDNDDDHDESTSPETINGNSLLLQVTVEDGDGDEASDTIDLGSIIKFEDDGPTAELALKEGAKLVLDESVGLDAGDPNANDEANSLLDLTDIGYAKILAGDLFTETADFGSDKEGSPAKTFSLVVDGVAPVLSGLVDTQSGQPVVLVDAGGGVVEGRTLVGNQLVFTVSVNSDSDVEVHQYRAVEHDDPTDHDEDVPNPGTEAETIDAGKLLLKLTVEDGDEDTASDTIDLGSIITFEDDGPTFDKTDFNQDEDGDSSEGVGLIDEDALPSGIAGGPGDDAGGLITDGTISFDFGSDGGSLSIDGLKITDSKGVEIPLNSLKTVDGQTITVTPSGPDGNGVVTWTAVVAAGEPDAGETVFTFKLDTEGADVGDFSFQLFRALEHPYTDEDFNNDGKDGIGDPQTAYEDNLLFDFTVVATDGDGDEATGHIQVSVDDDSPTVGFATSGTISLAVDETVAPDGTGDIDANGTNGTAQDGSRVEDDEHQETLPAALTAIGTVIGAATASAAGLFTFDFGADGGAATGNEVYKLNIDDPNTGLIDTATGDDILLFDMGNGVIVGRTETTLAVVFALTIDADGNISMAQYRAINHGDDDPNSYPDEVISLGAEKLSVTLTVTDADGDQASGTRDIGAAIKFEDDGPKVTASGAFSLAVDETVGGGGTDVDANGTNGTQQDGSAVENDEVTNLAAVTAAGLPTVGLIGANSAATSTFFTSSAGSDGEASKAYSFLITNGGNTGLTDTATGQPITLFVNGSTVEGRNTNGDVVFALAIDVTTGLVTMAQYRAVNHTDDGASSFPDETVTMLSGKLAVVLTVEDKDGDVATAQQDISGGIVFDDDGPTAVDDVKSAGTSGSITGNVLTDGATDDSFGTDGKGSPAITQVVFKGTTFDDDDDGVADGFINIKGDHGDLKLDTATGEYTYTRTSGITATGQDVFTYTIKDADGDTDDATLTVSVDAANILNGQFVTNTNVEKQIALVTFVDVQDPLRAFAQLIVRDSQGQQGAILTDAGFMIDSQHEHLVSMEATAGTKVIVTDFSLEGVQIVDKGNSQLEIDDKDTGANEATGIVSLITPATEAGTDQGFEYSEDDSAGAHNITDDNAGTAGTADYIFGGSNKDTITASTGANVLNGGDVLDAANNGVDTINGGAGTDVLVFDKADTLDGNAGFDIVRVDQGAIYNTMVAETLTLPAGLTNATVDMRNANILEVESILITEEAAASVSVGTKLMINASDVVDFTDSDKDLYVIGSKGDTLELHLDAGVTVGSITVFNDPTRGMSFNEYHLSNGGTLSVDQDVVVTVI